MRNFFQGEYKEISSSGFEINEVPLQKGTPKGLSKPTTGRKTHPFY